MNFCALVRRVVGSPSPGCFLRGLIVLGCPVTLAAAPLELKPEQTRWLAEHPVIRLASDPQWPPFSVADARGRVTGLDVDLVRLIEAQLGRRFERVPVTDWSEAMRKGKVREIDVLSGTARTTDRDEYFLFTAPYVSQAFGIITRADESFMATVGNLAGRRVATVPDHAVTERLRREHPEILLVSARNTEEALRLVSAGGADAVLTDLVNASYLIKTHGLMNLKISGIARYKFETRLAVRKDWPELVGILDAAIASLDEADKQRIVDQWVKVDYAAVVRWETFWRGLMWVTGAALLVVSAVFWHNHRLRRELVERRRVEQALRKAHDRLEHLNEEKNQIISMAAHDLRNPLTGVLLGAEMMNADNPTECRAVARDIQASARHMIQLISDLLDVQMLEAGHRKFRHESVDLAAVLRAVLAEYQPAAQRKRINLCARIASQLPIVHLDGGAVRQVWDNLVSNAVKYSPVGVDVAVTLTATDGVIRFEVRDAGPGIAPDELPQLFAKYTRLSARPTGGESSIGLGLSIVKQLTDGLGGRAWCESQLGRGATFIVELPVVAATGRSENLARTPVLV